MINKIESLKNSTPKYIKEFMNGCSIEEKIDAHYISVEIISRNDIKIKKANGKEIDRVDMIINSMWNKLFLDWNYLKLSNKDWFASHVGHVIKMFYFPCDTPIMTKYKKDLRYVFERVIFNNIDLDTRYILEDIKFPDSYIVDYKQQLDKIDCPDDVYNEHINKLMSGEESFSDVFKTLIKDSSKIYAENNPEGYIFRFNKRIYQLIINDENRKIDQEKTSYEFLLSDFVHYCNMHNYVDKIVQSYTKTVCNLYNDFIINFEKENHIIEKNIDPSGIEPPHLGAKFDIGYEYIPDQISKTLCKESELYKNIFKVLMADLRKGKDFSHCIYMTEKEVDDWNNIMKSIKIRNIYI